MSSQIKVCLSKMILFVRTSLKPSTCIWYVVRTFIVCGQGQMSEKAFFFTAMIIRGQVKSGEITREI